MRGGGRARDVRDSHAAYRRRALLALLPLCLAGPGSEAQGPTDRTATFNCSNGPGMLPNLLACPLTLEQREALRLGAVQVLFVHVPKSGGTTAETLLTELLRESSGREPRRAVLRRPGDTIKFLRKSVKERARMALLQSKATVHVDTAEDPGVLRLMATTVRNPVDRIVSNYKYSIPRSRRSTHLAAGACTMFGLNRSDLGAFVRWYGAHRGALIEYSNFATRLLVSQLENPAHLQASDGGRYVGRACELRPLPPVTDADLRWAMRRLARMSLIGLVEDLDESQRMWRRAWTGGPTRAAGGAAAAAGTAMRACGNAGHAYCAGATGVRATLAREYPVLLAQLEADNRFDIALWNYAARLYEAQRAAYAAHAAAAADRASRRSRRLGGGGGRSQRQPQRNL